MTTTSEDLGLTLAEWLVLSAICERSTHGFAIAALLGREGSVGRIWRVPKPVVYRAIARLQDMALVRAIGEEHSTRGPVRSLLTSTAAGQSALAQWLNTPVQHPRDVRSELMVKLALLDRAGADPQHLLLAQQMRLAPIAAALGERVQATSGFDHTLALWRHEAITATLRFLAELTPLS